MYNFPFSQNFSNNFQTRSFGFFGVVVILVLTFVIGCLAFKARHDQWKVWNSKKNITFVQDSPLLSTADGPYYVHMARTIDQINLLHLGMKRGFSLNPQKSLENPIQNQVFLKCLYWLTV